MLRRTPRRRSGFSLVEVLVALFIVAAGLIALLTLFPLGAIQMGKALQDDRSQQCALQADGKVRELWRARVIEAPAGEPFYTALDDAGGARPNLGTTLHRPSYPVVFDPIGYHSYTSNAAKQNSLAGGGAVPRRTTTSLPVLPTPLLPAVRYASLQDDMEFGPDGTPADRDGLPVNTNGNPIFRAGRYNYAAVIQRPDNSNRTVADLKILVFDRRVPGVNPSAPNNETVSTVTATVGSNQLAFPGTNDTYGFRAGTWLVDATNQVDATGSGIRNLAFYKVITYAEVGGNVVVETHIPIAKPKGEFNAASYTAQMYLLSELIDVYDRPQLTPSGYQKQTP